MSVDLKQEVFDELKIELQNEPTFTDEVLELKVKDAYRKVRSRKQYQNTLFTEEQIEKHIYTCHFLLFSVNKETAPFPDSCHNIQHLLRWYLPNNLFRS